MSSPVPAVTIAGGGVAGLEAALALRETFGARAPVTLVSAAETFHYKPLSVGEPFGLGRPHRHPLTPIAADLGIELVQDSLEAVVPEARRIRLGSGASLPYERLLVAVGAPTRAPCPWGVLFDGAHVPGEFEEVLADLRGGLISHVAFVIGSSITWPLPAYELALMTTAWGAAARPDGVRVSVVTHETEPLDLFGPAVSEAVAAKLARAGIEFVGGQEPVVDSDVLVRVGNHQLQAERIIVLPELTGPRIAGLPADRHGFVAVDRWGRVPGAAGVYAIGDAAAHPVKHGGLAAQQAAVAVQALAFDAGRRERLDEPRMILRGLVRTAGGPLYLRAVLGDERETSVASGEPLWWPPSKLAAPRLTSYLGRIEQARAQGRVLVTGGFAHAVA